MFATRFALVAIALGLASPALSQSSVVIWPTDPKIGAEEQATALWLENRGSKPVTLQVRTLGWDQAMGEDRQQATSEIVSSPPMAQVGPGERQLVRIIRRTPVAAGERAYRLLIDELPTPGPEGGEAVAARLAVQMRYSLPLFVYGADREAIAPKLTSRVLLDGGQRWIEISNEGSAHARLTDLRIEARDDAEMVHAGLVGYVLPGAAMRWALPERFDQAGALIVGVNGIDVPLSSQPAI